ncbi:hypothetical protein ACIOYT_00495 [Streptomyces halstedii]|uniref:hypothetical protein n=1 Tax=Streptomyces halstedii TaxID=1944 RepID=UPI00382FEB90
MTSIGIPPRTPESWDVPAEQVAQQIACDVLVKAAAVTHSPSDRIAYANDLYLLTHPEACSTTADYPDWAAWLDQQIALSDSTRRGAR